jgi:hypothetical protein
MWLHYKMHFLHPPGCGHTLQGSKFLLNHFQTSSVVIYHNFVDLDLNQPSKPCGCITRSTLYVLRDVGTACRDPRGPFEFPSLLWNLYFSYLDLHAKLGFAGNAARVHQKTIWGKNVSPSSQT